MVGREVKQELHIVSVLDAMNTYFRKENHNFHTSLKMAYCLNCESITPVGGNYTVFRGRDCLGDHYETKEVPERCKKCHTGKFIEISKYDMSELEEVYRGRTAEIVLGGIQKGLKGMDFPTLYNEELPGIANKWKRFNKKEKIRQINQLLDGQKKLASARKRARDLEEALA